MADLNSWVNTQKRRTLNELRGEVETLRRVVDRGGDPIDKGQRRMASRILTLIDLKLSMLEDTAARERAERETSWSEDDIDEGLKA